jgi:WD40 repeat protein
MISARAKATFLLLGAVMTGSCDRDVFTLPDFPMGMLRVTVSTSGHELDPDGYEVMLNNSSGVAIPINGTITNRIGTGTHVVRLGGIAANCVVADNNPRTVTVTVDATTDVAFVATCATTASVHVTAITTGTDLDPDGYVVRVTVSGQYWRPLRERALPTNGVVLLPGLTAGLYDLTLRHLAVNCDVSDKLPRTVNLASGDTAALAFNVACTPTTRLLFVRGTDPDILVINSNGTGATRIAAFSENPAWSPDESRIAFTSKRNGNREIQVMHTDGSSPQRLTSASAPEYQPAWSPDGSRIAFVSERDGTPELYVMNADGTGQVRLSNNAANDRQPAWSPDGSRIAFTSNRDGTSWIYLMNTDGSGVERLSNQAAPDENPAWSPDGRRLAFTRELCHASSGCTPQLFVMNANGTGAAPLGDSGIQPAWSPDGRLLAYTAVVCDFYYYYDHDCYPTGIRIIDVVDGDVVELTTLPVDSQPAWRR